MTEMPDGDEMVMLDKDDWPIMLNIESEALKIWVSSKMHAVLLRQRVDGNVRLTITSDHDLSWDELQEAKNKCLGEDVWCVEVYPAQDKVVNLANQRHLWVLDEPPSTRFPETPFMTDEEVVAYVKKMIEGEEE